MFNKFIILLFLFSIPISVHASAQEFKVGVIIPLTGPAADYGVAVKNGIELAEKENGNKFSKINFIYEDGAYDANAVLTALNKLYLIDKVDLLYVWGVKYCFLASSFVEKYKLPTVAQCVHPDIAKDKDYIIRFLNYSNEYMEVLNKYIKKSNYNNIATVVSEDAYAEECFKAFKEEVDNNIHVSEIASFQPKEMDFRSALTRIKNKKYQAVVAFLAPGQNGQFAKQMKQLNINIPILGHNTYESFSEIALSQGGMEGAIFTNNRVSPEFKDYYYKKYDTDNQITWAGFSYEFTKMLETLEIKLLTANSSLEIMNIVSAYPAKPNSVVGDINFYNTPKVGKYFGFPIVIKTIKDAKIIELN